MEINYWDNEAKFNAGMHHSPSFQNTIDKKNKTVMESSE